jgi:cobalamin biosynthesis protein CobT
LILENAKLLYQNKALNSTSLNERQKTKIVEAVRNANTVEEMKMLFETLQSAVGAHRERRPESLREAVSNKPTTSMLLSGHHASNRSDRTSTVDPNMDRMLRLAGLK